MTGPKFRKFESSLSNLPPLTLVLGPIPEPDPAEPFRFSAQEKPEETRKIANKLIQHLKDKPTC